MTRMHLLQRLKPRLRRALDAWQERHLPPPHAIPHHYSMPELDGLAAKRLELRSQPGSLDFMKLRLPDLPWVPGMTTEEEAKYLYWLTSQGYTGHGAVVEVGTWMGRSTIHLAAGLRDAGYLEHLHCFDQYRWMPAYEAPRLEAGISLPPDADFMPYFEKNVRPVYPGLRVDKVSLDELRWDRGPIEILFLDAPKTYRQISRTLAHFSPHLVPGLSVVVFQDYLLASSYCIATLVSSIPQPERLHVVPESSSVSFALRGPMAVSRPIEAWSYEKRDLGEIEAAWSELLEPLDPTARCLIEPGLALLLYDRGLEREAADKLRSIRFTEHGLRHWKFMGRCGHFGHYRALFDLPLAVSES